MVEQDGMIHVPVEVVKSLKSAVTVNSARRTKKTPDLPSHYRAEDLHLRLLVSFDLRFWASRPPH